MPLENQHSRQPDASLAQPSLNGSESPSNEEALPLAALGHKIKHTPKPLTTREVLQLQRSIGNQKVMRLLAAQKARPTAKATVIQRNVGMELETQPDWAVTTKGDDPKAVTKGTPIIHRPHFQLQAEYSSDTTSNLEFVTNPPGVKNRGEYTEFRAAILALRAELNAKANTAPFTASELTGGEGAYTIRPGTTQIKPHLQVTAGVPLASVEALLKNLNDIGAQGTINYAGSAAKGRNLATKFATDAGLEGPSQELIGFVSMIQRYLAEGAGDPNATGHQVATFPKGVFSVMARTDFKKMFSMLPEAERNAIAANMDSWVTTMLSKNVLNRAYAPDGGVMSQVFDDPQSETPAMKINTSRDDWLRTMPERDLLTYKGKQSVTPAVSADATETAKLQAEATKGIRGVEVMAGKRTTEDPTFKGYTHAEAQPDVVRMEAAPLAKMVSVLKDIYQGMGALGNTVDLVQYDEDEDEDEDDTATEAIIVEIRRPPEVSSDNWGATMDAVYDAVDEAIKYPTGKSHTERRTRTERTKGFLGTGLFSSARTVTENVTVPHASKDYDGVLTPKQQEFRDSANTLRTVVEETNAKAKEDV